MTPEPRALPAAELLAQALAEAAHLLPAQGPIGVFIHHNTLHALQHLRFEQAVEEAAALLDAEPYLPEARYREEYARGRITERDLDAVLADTQAGARAPLLGGRIERLALRRLLMLHGTQDETPRMLAWRIHEQGLTHHLRRDLPPLTAARLVQRTREHLYLLLEEGDLLAAGRAVTGETSPAAIADALDRTFGLPFTAAALTAALERDGEQLAAQALWQSCRRRAPAPPPVPPAPPSGAVRHRDRLLALTGEDLDERVHPMLIRLCAAFLDQGVAYWPMPEREQGFCRAVRLLYLRGSVPPVDWLLGLRRELAEHEARGLGAADIVLEILGDLGVAPADWEAYLGATLRALPGWAGIMHQLERRPELAPRHAPPCALVDLLAVRLILERHALRHLARHHLGHDGPLAALPLLPLALPTTQPAAALAEEPDPVYRLFQVLQLAGLSFHELDRLPEAELTALHDELRSFDETTRRRLWHLAYERHYRSEVLDALATHAATPSVASAAAPPLKPAPSATEPARCQVLFCIDDREESLRRHLEELGPGFETFGVPGFFGVAVYFHGLDQPRPVPLCPVAIQPAHEVRERPLAEDRALLERRAERRRLWASLARGTFIGSRSLVRGWITTLGLGLLAAFPLVMRSLFPRLVARLGARLGETLLPAPRSVLTVRREEEERAAAGASLGFSPEEKIERVARVLEDAGLVANFAPLVALLGHGSSSLNNPHESAYDCGACGGRRGGPNARLWAEMANLPHVRAGLRDRGIDIPDRTWFIGGYHDTCSDQALLFGADRVPATHHAAVAALRAALEQARQRSAHERCRRFELVPLDASPAEALAEVETRAAHLAEPRPEYGHATNAICVVGRRALTRGLFLDRRAFLASYDPTLDRDGDILARSLAAVLPVGAGINLEYYFSRVDNEVYGCGTKLPHNVTDLLGVMNGHASDLRTGLTWQMVELHEPMRLLLIVETRPEFLLRATQRNPLCAELVSNRWVQVCTIDPETRAIHVLGDAGFVPHTPARRPLPVAPSSLAWYRGKREHLPIARIDPTLDAAARRAAARSL